MPTKQQITVRIEMQYGNERIFPVDENAKLFCALKRGKSLTAADVKLIKQLGYIVNVAPTVTNL